MTELFGDPISTYSRAEALTDGVLVDVSQTAREAGLRFPVALTAAAHSDCVAWTEADNERLRALQDPEGRLWDVLSMLRLAITRSSGGSQIEFQVYRVARDGQSTDPELVTLIATCGPGDDAEPVITVDLHP